MSKFIALKAYDTGETLYLNASKVTSIINQQPKKFTSVFADNSAIPYAVRETPEEVHNLVEEALAKNESKSFTFTPLINEDQQLHALNNAEFAEQIAHAIGKTYSSKNKPSANDNSGPIEYTITCPDGVKLASVDALYNENKVIVRIKR